VRPPFPLPNAARIRALLLAAAGAALLAAFFGWVLRASPYEAPWAWISFIGMCVVDDVVLGSGPAARRGELPKVALLAAIIVFRRHPEITLLVVVIAAPLAGVLKSQRWPVPVTATAQWLLAAIVGAAAFRLIGFGDAPHFVAATAGLMVIYFLLGPALTVLLDEPSSWQRYWLALIRHSSLAVPLELAGVALALAWRTAPLQAAALKVADAALVAVAGFAIAFVFRGRVARLLRLRHRIPARPALVAAFILLLSQVTPSPLSWFLPLALAGVAGAWAVWRGVMPVACGALGAFCNEIVRGANAGFMPVEGSGVLAGIGTATTYVLAGPKTNLAWLDDRFHLPPPFPGIASAGDILIAVGMAWLIASVMVRRQRALHSDRSATADQVAAA
jgi:hypothetical protein